MLCEELPALVRTGRPCINGEQQIRRVWIGSNEQVTEPGRSLEDHNGLKVAYDCRRTFRLVGDGERFEFKAGCNK